MKNSPKRKKSQRTLRFFLEHVIDMRYIHTTFFECTDDLPSSAKYFLKCFAENILCTRGIYSIIVPFFWEDEGEGLGVGVLDCWSVGGVTRYCKTCHLEVYYECWFFFFEYLEEARVGEWGWRVRLLDCWRVGVLDCWTFGSLLFGFLLWLLSYFFLSFSSRKSFAF